MSERDDNRYGEDVCSAFAMYCDENGLTLEEGQDLAERLGNALETVATDRGEYLDVASDMTRG